MMSNWSASLRRLRDQQGATAVLVGLSIFALIGMGALAIDLSHFFLVRNELQNAADAGALAGARFLYNSDGMAVNAGANQIAYNAATENRSERVPVDVHWAGGNTGDVQRGHWSFATRTFTPNDSLLPVLLWNVSWEELDQNPNFINAVRVRTRREDTPAASFLARIFGRENFILSSEAIAYIGFAGILYEHEVDEPIVICKQSLLGPNNLSDCTVGRMINSGQNMAAHETGGWTDFNQEDNPCQGGTNANAVRSLIDRGGNDKPIYIHKGPVATNGGEIATAFTKFRQTWARESLGRTQPWKVTLVLIECEGNNIGTCADVVGAVSVDILWVTGEGEDPAYNDAPTQMKSTGKEASDWIPSSADGRGRWREFASFFNLKNLDGSDAPYEKKSIYFSPNCVPLYLGGTGGENFGILAKIPVLVK